MTPSMAVAMTALVFSTTGSAFAAKTLIDSSDIKNGSITSADIKDGSLTTRDVEEGSINLDRLSDGTQRRINEKPRDGKDGTNGRNGVNGANGANGRDGAAGATGAKGEKGDRGNDGADAQYAVRSLTPFAADESTAQSAGWRSYNGNVDSAPSVDDDGIKFGPFAAPGDWHSAYTYAVTGTRVKDLALLAYSAKYTGGTGTGAAPYIIVVTDNGSGGENHITFSPNTETGVTPKAGTWQRWVVTQGTARYNQDSVGTEIAWSDIVRDQGDQTIKYISLQAGNSAGSAGSTSHVKNVTLEANGAEGTFASYTFGS